MKRSIILPLLFVNLFGVSLPENRPYPGGVIVEEVESRVAPEAYLGKQRLMVLPAAEKERYYIVAGVGLNQKTEEPCEIVVKEGEKQRTLSVGLQEKAYEKQYITIKNTRMVSPEKMDMKRINDEARRSREALALFTEQKFRSLSMVKPVDVDIFGVELYRYLQPGLSFPSKVILKRGIIGHHIWVSKNADHNHMLGLRTTCAGSSNIWTLSFMTSW